MFKHYLGSYFAMAFVLFTGGGSFLFDFLLYILIFIFQGLVYRISYLRKHLQFIDLCCQ